MASNEGHVELIDIFHRYGSYVDCRAKTMRTPLHVACIRGNFSVIKALLHKGADVDAQDSDGNTPCHFCSEYGHSDCLELLLHMKHPQLVTKNKDNVSPLDVAVNKEILQKFTDYINSVKNILRSQRGSSKASRSSHTSGNGSTNVNNTAEGNSAKVPVSVKKPDRQTSQTNLNLRKSPRAQRQQEVGTPKQQEQEQKRKEE